jgi:hypothetical protein
VLLHQADAIAGLKLDGLPKAVISACLRLRAHRVFDIPGTQSLAERKDDLAAAIDEDGSARALEPLTDGDLDNRDCEQRNEKDDHRTHEIPPQPDEPVEATIKGYD